VNANDKAERERVTAEELEILDQLERLLLTYEDFDRKFRFDLFCSASMLCLSTNDYSSGMKMPPVAGDYEMIGKTSGLMKLELGRGRNALGRITRLAFRPSVFPDP
jgi:hypothetical protein